MSVFLVEMEGSCTSKRIYSLSACGVCCLVIVAMARFDSASAIDCSMGNPISCDRNTAGAGECGHVATRDICNSAFAGDMGSPCFLFSCTSSWFCQDQDRYKYSCTDGTSEDQVCLTTDSAVVSERIDRVCSSACCSCCNDNGTVPGSEVLGPGLYTGVCP